MWIHGYLHLLGYDHKKVKDYKVMKKMEDKILKILSIETNFEIKYFRNKSIIFFFSSFYFRFFYLF